MADAVQRLETPVGDLHLVLDGSTLQALALPGRWDAVRASLERRLGRVPATAAPASGPVADALRAYFDGDSESLDRITTDPGGSEFQRRTWDQLRRIPWGETVSYRDIAERLGRPTAFRAVATANAQNPVAIVIPCHRVIHADGTISGFGGGVDLKRWLLHHEARSKPFRLTAPC